MLKELFGLLGMARSSTEIGELASDINIGGLEAALDSAKETRAAALLDGTIEDVLAAERAIDIARVNLERAQIAAEEIERRRLELAEIERKAEFESRRAAAQDGVDRAVWQIEAEYPGHARRIVELALLAKSADVAASKWNEERLDAPYEAEVIELVGGRLGWTDEFLNAPAFYDAPSLPPAADFGGFGSAGNWATHVGNYALNGIALPSPRVEAQIEHGVRWKPEG
ncbi:hypothetical protein JHL21_03405 [Devosia sp. WQ 349]|uniref:hypothetical protein n=1 Tax=Devosia sp. WQ 349K1 TaxID=2800329 RepID=UPI001903BF52|nr:hypothetical protein [Devosia sp. WQ 349K1]MBK1793538.1 hypothetical protein [Devosia sp. WQ 349K1]